MKDWGRYAGATARVVLYAYAYVLLEWLFQATKPSFLGVWPVGLRVAGFWMGALPFVGAALALHLVCCLLQWLASSTGRGHAGLLLKITPALVAAAIALMLVDNFTYTVFGLGVVDTTVWTAPVYWLLALLVVALHLRRPPTASRVRVAAAVALVLVSAGVLLWAVAASPHHADADRQASAHKGPWPNIVMFASDGITASRMSAYGNVRLTTPNLDARLNQALVADNAFTNSGWTTGSLTSMMTGKYPTTTKVMYPPYTLHGVDAYQSLPRILHGLGYAGIQETVRYYADGPDLNWQDAFDQANGRQVEPSPLDGEQVALQVPWLLDQTLYRRLSERVKQLLFIEKMVNPHAEVTSAKVYGTPDSERMRRVYGFIDQARKPFFVHIHLMGTHCCKYHPPREPFSAGASASKAEQEQTGLDNAVLESDRLFGELVAHLEQRHLLDNTLIVYTSDHDTRWDFREPVPLIFLFPSGAHRGHVAQTTQLLDVAPTVLDYLGLQVPEWMEGRSLLAGGLAPTQPVFSVFRLTRSHFANRQKDWLARVDNMGPPTYGLSRMGMVVCQRWYVMGLDDGTITTGEVADYHGACPQEALPDDARARAMISEHLHQRGFVF